MIVETSGGRHQCDSAEQRKDGVYLLDSNGDIVLIIETPWDIKAVEGGEIVIAEQPEPTTAEILNAMLGVSV